MTSLRIKRGTRAQLDAAAAANGLAVGEPYLITDEGRIAVGTGTTTYAAHVLTTELGDRDYGLITGSLTSTADYGSVL